MAHQQIDKSKSIADTRLNYFNARYYIKALGKQTTVIADT